MDLYSVMHDPDYWKNPGEFRPERFLDEEGRYKPDERWGGGTICGSKVLLMNVSRCLSDAFPSEWERGTAWGRVWPRTSSFSF